MRFDWPSTKLSKVYFGSSGEPSNPFTPVRAPGVGDSMVGIGTRRAPEVVPSDGVADFGRAAPAVATDVAGRPPTAPYSRTNTSSRSAPWNSVLQHSRSAS